MAEEKAKNLADGKYSPKVFAGHTERSIYVIVPDDNDEFYKTRFEWAGGKYISELNRYEFNKANLYKLQQKCFVYEYNTVYVKETTPTYLADYLDIFGGLEKISSLGGVRDIVQKINDYVTDKRIPVFTYDKFLNIKYNGSGQKDDLVFSGLLSQFLKTGRIADHIELNFMPKIITKYYAAIYCDIIEDQYVGDSHGPIIRLINLNTDPTAEAVTLFENPHYVPCNKTIINSINIRILDLEGNLIQFENKFGFVILKLHIRKKNEY